MLVGIDASRALSSAPTGTETYSRELIAAVLRAPSDSYFRLYTRAVPPPHLFPNTGNYDVRPIPFPRLWTHLRLSAEMLRQPPDALLVPAHVLPPIHPPRSYVTIHDLGYLHFPQAHRKFARRYLALTTRWNALAATRVLADSQATREDLARYYHVAPDKIHVLYPALSPLFRTPPRPEDIARVRVAYSLPSNYLLAVGTVQPRKNYVRLAQAFRRLPDRSHLIIAGKRGWLSGDVVRAIEQEGPGGRLRWLDYVPASDLPALYAGASLFVFPSLYEGFGIPILEAQACGVPIACSNTSSLPEVAGDGAEYFDPLDVDAMAAAILRVLDSPARRSELIDLGCANLQRFSWDRSARELLELISSDR